MYVYVYIYIYIYIYIHIYLCVYLFIYAYAYSPEAVGRPAEVLAVREIEPKAEPKIAPK